MDDPSGKVALVTGAGTGMGRATLVQLAGAGARVVAVGRTDATLEAALAEARDAGGEGIAVVADVGTEDGARRAIAGAADRYGGLDILINNASVGWAYEQVVPGSMADAHAYAAAKAGVINLSRSLARTYGPEQIRCNCLAPGVVDTGMIDPYRQMFEDTLADPVAGPQLCPLGRMGTAEEAADAIVFLALATYCNGSVLVMDGGTSA